jgi:hypothetical protein
MTEKLNDTICMMSKRYDIFVQWAVLSTTVTVLMMGRRYIDSGRRISEFWLKENRGFRKVRSCSDDMSIMKKMIGDGTLIWRYTWII